MPTSVYDIQVDGDWAYIALAISAAGSGVIVYDIHDPYNPTLLGTYPGQAGVSGSTPG